MRAEDTVRYLQAVKNRDKYLEELVDRVVKDEEVMTKEEALRLLRNKPVSGDGKRDFLRAKVSFFISVGMGVIAGLLYLHGGSFGYPLGISLASLFIAFLFYLGGLILEREAEMSDEEYLKEMIKEAKYEMSAKVKEEEVNIDILDPRSPYFIPHYNEHTSQ